MGVKGLRKRLCRYYDVDISLEIKQRREKHCVRFERNFNQRRERAMQKIQLNKTTKQSNEKNKNKKQFSI